MLDRLEEGLEHERMFVADASHELRMPLAVLKAELEVSLRERGGERHLRAALDSAVEETDRIIKLAEDLLLLARAQDGTLPIESVELDLEELLSELHARFEPIVERDSRSLALEPVAIPTTIVVRGDRDRIAQAVSNLIDNTLRYGGGPITLSARPAAGSIEIHVTDRGSGFGEFLPHARLTASAAPTAWPPARRRRAWPRDRAHDRPGARRRRRRTRPARRRGRRVGHPARERVPQPRPGARRLSVPRSHPGLTSIAHLLLRCADAAQS